MPTRGGISRPLTYALVVHWLSILVEHFWTGIVGKDVLPLWNKVLGLVSGPDHSIESLGRLPWFHHSKDMVLAWFWKAGPVIVDPFMTLLKLLLFSMIIFMGARMILTDRSTNGKEVTFESILRILCYSTAGALVSVVPWVGAPLSNLARLILAVIGIMSVYGANLPRAAVVAFFPYLLFVGTFALGVLGSLTLLYRMFTS